MIHNLWKIQSAELTYFMLFEEFVHNFKDEHKHFPPEY